MSWGGVSERELRDYYDSEGYRNRKAECDEWNVQLRLAQSLPVGKLTIISLMWLSKQREADPDYGTGNSPGHIKDLLRVIKEMS